MNKIANQFTSIEQVADQYLNPSKSNKTQPEQGLHIWEQGGSVWQHLNFK